MSLRVKLVVPEGEVWAGTADRVIAKTLDGDIGILGSHTPVLGILAPGSVVRILPEDSAAGSSTGAPAGSSAGSSAGGWIQAAVGDGFLSVADDRVSILARQAMLGSDVDKAATRAELESTLNATPPGQDEPAVAGYLRAQLRAAGDEA